MRLGLIADTHGLLRPEALDALRGSEHILHAGDIGAAGVLDALGAIAPVTAIRGNNDTAPWAAHLPDTYRLVLGGIALYMLHDLKELHALSPLQAVDVVVAGHSHRPLVERRADGLLVVNPGSAGPRRFRLPVSVARLDIDEGRVRASIIELAV